MPDHSIQGRQDISHSLIPMLRLELLCGVTGKVAIARNEFANRYYERSR
jgi:hypothetical protein